MKSSLSLARMIRPMIIPSRPLTSARTSDKASTTPERTVLCSLDESEEIANFEAGREPEFLKLFSGGRFRAPSDDTRRSSRRRTSEAREKAPRRRPICRESCTDLRRLVDPQDCLRDDDDREEEGASVEVEFETSKSTDSAAQHHGDRLDRVRNTQQGGLMIFGNLPLASSPDTDCITATNQPRSSSPAKSWRKSVVAFLSPTSDKRSNSIPLTTSGRLRRYSIKDLAP